MKIVGFKVYEFSLPLRRPLTTDPHHLTHRTGLIIELTSEDAHVVLGEISPLPGLSREGMTEVKSQTARLRSWAMGRELPHDLEALSGGFNAWLGGQDLGPSVRFGFETAALNLFAVARALPLCKLICQAPRDWISVNCLLTGSADEIADKAASKLNMGYTAFKLKVGLHSIERDMEIARKLRQVIGSHTRLRLDANRGWNIDEALAFAEGTADLNIEYIEEPVRTLAELKRLMAATDMPLPIALDESLLELTPDTLSSIPGVRAVVIKPTVSGFERAMGFARSALSAGMTPVVSSAFESGVALGVLAQMAACVNMDDVPAGLDTLDWLEEDLLVSPIRFQRGRLQVAALAHPPQEIRRDLLKEGAL